MATNASTDAQIDAYDQLCAEIQQISAVQSASGVLSWDQQVMMPSGGTPARSKQLSTLSSLSHELLVDGDVGSLLDELEATELSDEQAAVVREVRRQYDRANRVPTELVSKISETTSEALNAWESAKANDDFEQFAPHLETLVELKREYAAYIDPDADPYAVLFADYEPWLPLSQAESILEELRETLVPLIEEIRNSDADVTTNAFSGTYPESVQEDLSRDVLSILNYDWDRGRLDVSSHPFTSGNQFDCRVTTRFDEADPLGALTATIHEFGHAWYNLGLPQDHFGTPLGESRNLSVHESQSRLWENHVGRSQPFWEHILPTVKEHFDGTDDLTAAAAYESANQVYEDNFIRVESDELTYHMHIIIRFEIEQELISGDLDVDDVPERWNDLYEEYLGIRPETDTVGCLQDIHWSHGSFGYFPTYSLGSVMAAQLFAAAEDELGNLDEQFRAGEFDALTLWLRENIHQHGQLYKTNELVVEATGEDFTAEYFLDYVTEKYGTLYEL
ncbi:carboxypeptidase M32 [Natronocalculus amylovorans]|uniref:Metal-dependent carboxypeptidase n=1 Tax=Natronocalculus amylovorans TaxID=2917812 RepID=A0AAE3FUR1_9EURY|nr:carboxypeptidase M32 [Natronocalculus amylovorans]MCL9815724.1 carboxypeptidase M32 [Natronocalculus amylovorans]